MAKTVKFNCDVCGVELMGDTHGTQVPVGFTTEQTEGRPVPIYVSMEKLDICRDCMTKIAEGLPLRGSGAMGGNTYFWKK